MIQYDKLQNSNFKNHPKILLTEKEKEDLIEVKNHVAHYETLGFYQVSAKQEHYRKLHNLADGVIDRADYVSDETINQLRMLDPSLADIEDDQLEMENFPIIPVVLNRLVGDIEKRNTKFRIQAVNTEATNSILEKKNEEIRNTLVSLAQQTLESQYSPEELSKNRDQLMQDLPATQRAYRTDYMLEIENWANHVMKIEDEKFDIKNVERKLFKELFTTEDPYLHVNMVGDDYYPEVLNPANCFYLKSPEINDVSEGHMFGWFTFEDLTTILNKYGSELDQEQVSKLSQWADKLSSNFVLTETWSQDEPLIQNMQNAIAWDQLHRGLNYREDLNHKLIRVTNMYFILPKKVGILTSMLNGELTVTKVSDDYKPEKGVYKYKNKIRENLIEGEHIDYIYTNELWRCIKLDLNWSTPYNKIDDSKTIYVYLGRNKIQHRAKKMRYGIKIPVHGGSIFNASQVEKASSWQRLYNFLWNRSKQILSTEIGKFVAFPQNLIPETSFDGSWGENNLIKGLLVAKDTSMLPIDTSITNRLNMQGVSGNFGQMIDLSKTSDVLEKAQLAAMIKNECYEALGMSMPMLGDQSPYMSAKAVAQNLQTSITQLQHLFSRHFDIMKWSRETMLEMAQYLTSKNKYRELTYLNTDQQREIFKLNIEETLIYELALYPVNRADDYINLEMMKNMILADQSMQTSAYERAQVIAAESSSEVLSSLKTMEAERQKAMEEQRAHEGQMQQNEIDARQKEKETLMNFEAEQNMLDREMQITKEQINAMGYAGDNAKEIYDQIIKLQTENQRQKEYYDRLSMQQKIQEMDSTKMEQDREMANKELSMKEKLELKKLELRQEELKETKRRNTIQAKKNNPVN